MFSIRSYQEEDLENVLKIYQDVTEEIETKPIQSPQGTKIENPQPFKNYFTTSALEQVLDNSYTVVAESEGRLVGFASIFLSQHYIDCLYIDKNFRRNGIAHALLTTLEEKAIQKGIEILTVESPASLRAFFEKMGFHVVTNHNKKIKDSVSLDYIMNKEICIPSKNKTNNPGKTN